MTAEIYVNCFDFRPVFEEEMSFKDVSILALVVIVFSGAEVFVQLW